MSARKNKTRQEKLRQEELAARKDYIVFRTGITGKPYDFQRVENCIADPHIMKQGVDFKRDSVIMHRYEGSLTVRINFRIVEDKKWEETIDAIKKANK